MSRIHEALKKAEQERTAVQGGEPQPVSASPAAAEPPITAAGEPSTDGHARVPGGGNISLAAARSSLTDSFSLDALLTRSTTRTWMPDQKTMLFFDDHHESSRGMEEFRTLRSRLYHLRDKMPLKKILVASALPNEGRSFTAANLAQVLVRQQGCRVLLIDADLRGPRLHEMLGTTSAPGLSNYLQGGNDEFSIMQRGPMENLFFIPSGECSNPSELVANGQLEILLRHVEALFDWIVVDSPPAVLVSDASVLGTACDGVLMVVRSNSTPADMAQRARQEFPDNALIGVVLNGVNSAVAPYTR